MNTRGSGDQTWPTPQAPKTGGNARVRTSSRSNGSKASPYVGNAWITSARISSGTLARIESHLGHPLVGPGPIAAAPSSTRCSTSTVITIDTFEPVAEPAVRLEAQASASSRVGMRGWWAHRLTADSGGGEPQSCVCGNPEQTLPHVERRVPAAVVPVVARERASGVQE